MAYIKEKEKENKWVALLHKEFDDLTSRGCNDHMQGSAMNKYCIKRQNSLESTLYHFKYVSQTL